MKLTSVTLQYFAYGSNLLFERLRERVPSTKIVGMGFINRFVLQFYKRSIDGSGKCTIIPTSNEQDRVYGMITVMDEADKPRLDRAEGLGHGYYQHRIEVKTPHGTESAFTYVAEHVDETLQPYTWYRDLVVAGAVQNNFPEGYVARLERIEADVDSNQGRELKNRQILNKQSSGKAHE